jgi:hypothetical protein
MPACTSHLASLAHVSVALHAMQWLQILMLKSVKSILAETLANVYSAAGVYIAVYNI